MSEKNKDNAEEKKIIIERLNSDNPIILKETLLKLREKGDSEFIPLLFDLLLKYTNSNIANSIKDFISDIKDSSVKEFLINSIKTEKYKCIKKELLTICWESRFDFSDHLDLFVDILINDDFIIAFEALTVIENLSANISEEIKIEQINRLKEAILKADNTKQQLIHDAIHIIPHIKYSKF